MNVIFVAIVGFRPPILHTPAAVGAATAPGAFAAAGGVAAPGAVGALGGVAAPGAFAVVGAVTAPGVVMLNNLSRDESPRCRRNSCSNIKAVDETVRLPPNISVAKEPLAEQMLDTPEQRNRCLATGTQLELSVSDKKSATDSKHKGILLVLCMLHCRLSQ